MVFFSGDIRLGSLRGCSRQFTYSHCGSSFGSPSDAYLVIMGRERGGWRSSSGNGKGFSPLIQPLSCFRGLLGIFLSLPLKQTADIGSEPERQRAEGFHCAAADVGQRRDKLLCLGFIIYSWETRDSRDCCQEGLAATYWRHALSPVDHERPWSGRA